MSDVLDGVRRELKRILEERDRLRRELSRRTVRHASLSPAHRNGLEACALLSDIADVLSNMGKDRFFNEYHTSAADLAKLISVCEDDARGAGPLIEKDAQWMGNRIRTQLI